MQTNRTGPSESVNRNDRAGAEDRNRRPLEAGEVERFQRALDIRRLQDRLQDPRNGAGNDDQALASGSLSSLAASDPAALQALIVGQQAQAASIDAPQQAATTHLTPNLLSDLLERHVRQMLASESATADGDGRIHLSLNDATLPATDLVLERHSEGWRLVAEVGSHEAYESIERYAPALVERFAQRHLGALEISPRLTGHVADR